MVQKCVIILEGILGNIAVTKIIKNKFKIKTSMNIYFFWGGECMDIEAGFVTHQGRNELHIWWQFNENFQGKTGYRSPKK